jgi:endo-1,4-beta-xylanase
LSFCGWALVACSALVPATASALGSSETGLRALADHRGVSLGAAIRPEFLDDEDYVRVLKNNFNAIVPENDLKWEMIRLSPTKFDFSGVDALVAFAEENKMAIRGHTLVWHNQNPGWLNQLPDDPAVWQETLHQHIATVVGEYKGRIRDWDVVNEVVGDNGAMRETVWSKHLGPGYIAHAFRWAHEADPAARLFINDYSTETPGTKSDLLYQLVKDLKSQGVPLDGVGFQCHLDGSSLPDFDAMRANFQRFADLGLEVEVTELDVRMPGVVDRAALDQQAEIYGGLLKVLLDGHFGKTVMVWGVTDLRSWIPGFFPGFGSALLFDEEAKAKPAVAAWAKVLAEK